MKKLFGLAGGQLSRRYIGNGCSTMTLRKVSTLCSFMFPTMTDSAAARVPNLKPLDVKFKGDLASLQGEIMKGKILEQAANQLKNNPGFNPAALSIVFGLKW